MFFSDGLSHYLSKNQEIQCTDQPLTISSLQLCDRRFQELCNEPAGMELLSARTPIESPAIKAVPPKTQWWNVQSQPMARTGESSEGRSESTLDVDQRDTGALDVATTAGTLNRQATQ